MGVNGPPQNGRVNRCDADEKRFSTLEERTERPISVVRSLACDAAVSRMKDLVHVREWRIHDGGSRRPWD